MLNESIKGRALEEAAHRVLLGVGMDPYLP